MAYEPVIRYRMSVPSVQGVWHTVFSAGGVSSGDIAVSSLDCDTQISTLVLTQPHNDAMMVGPLSTLPLPTIMVCVCVCVCA